MKYGTRCCVAPHKGELKSAIVISHHPEAGAVKVRISGDDWILRENEVIKDTKETEWPGWLQEFVNTVRQTRQKRKTPTTEINKAEAARKLQLPYSRVVSICDILQSIGVTLVSK